jgi:hypothetical protein
VLGVSGKYNMEAREVRAMNSIYICMGEAVRVRINVYVIKTVHEITENV